MIVGNAGVLVSRVLRIKEGSTRTFVVLDAGMNDLLRPALYGAWHDIVPVREPDPLAGTAVGSDVDATMDGAMDEADREVDIVGPICETSDTFATARRLPPLGEGDLVAIRTAGAYGRAMASGYNARPLPPEVLVDGAAWSVVQDRVSVDDMLARQHLPPWLSEINPRRDDVLEEDEDGRRTAAGRA